MDAATTVTEFPTCFTSFSLHVFSSMFFTPTFYPSQCGGPASQSIPESPDHTKPWKINDLHFQQLAEEHGQGPGSGGGRPNDWKDDWVLSDICIVSVTMTTQTHSWLSDWLNIQQVCFFMFNRSVSNFYLSKHTPAKNLLVRGLIHLLMKILQNSDVKDGSRWQRWNMFECDGLKQENKSL